MLPEIFSNILGVIYLPLFLLLLYSSPQLKPPSPFSPSYHMYPFSKVPPTMVLFGSPGSCGWSAIIWGIVIHTKYKAKYEVMAQLVECLLTVNVIPNPTWTGSGDRYLWWQHSEVEIGGPEMQDHPQLQRKSEMEMGYMRPTKKISMCVHIYVCMHIYIYTYMWYICGRNKYNRY